MRLPNGYRFYPDRERETNSRAIEWATKTGDDAIFATLTFKHEVSMKYGRKTLGRWLARAQQRFIDTGGQQLRSVTATEWQKRGVIHYHVALIENGGSLSRKKLEGDWRRITHGSIAACYDAGWSMAAYLAKYTSKSLAGELEWDGDWRGYNFPGSVGALPVGVAN